MKQTNILILAVIIVLTMVTSVNAVSTKTTTNQINLGDNALELKFTDFDTMLVNKDTELDIHVFNRSTGLPLNSSINCILHLYNISGEHLVTMQDNTVDHGFDYEFLIGGGNFTDVGDYSYIAECFSTTQGGYAYIDFKVTNADEENFIIYAAIIIVSIIMAGLLFYAANFLAKEHAPIKFFLLFVGFLQTLFSYRFALAALTETQGGFIDSIALAVSISGYIYYILMAYFIFHLIYVVFMSFKNRGRHG